jgi:hypothetical protein
MIDTSGSMNQPATKIRAARKATAAAIDQIRDGVWFAVIAGDSSAHLVYPDGGGTRLLAASSDTRAAAQHAVGTLDAGGGTAMSTWLRMADELFGTRPGAIHHGILLTDGQNHEGDNPNLAALLSSCAGRFQVDCRGVGTDWQVAQLREIATTLLGTVDIIPEPETMESEFKALIENAMGKQVGSVGLRVWTPQGAHLNFVRQVAPEVQDLTAQGRALSPMLTEYPTGAWSGNESRDYHLSVTVAPGAVGDEMLAGRTRVVVGDDVVADGMVKAIWTDDEALSTKINPEVAHYTGQAELAQAIQEGLEARRQGDDRTATVKLGRAVQLASESGNDGTVQLLRKVVDVDDPATGTVRLKKDVEAVDEMALDTRSTKTVRVGGKP